MKNNAIACLVAAGVLAALAGCAGPKAGKLVIVKAVYGDLPDGASVDVTAKVAAMVKDDTLRVDASNDVFGDPADEAFKKLRVQYTLGGVAGDKTVGEDQTLTLPGDEKPLVGKLVIVKAVYGDLAGTDVVDVTAKVAALVKNDVLTVVASNEVLADSEDPVAGVFERLRVDYTIGGVAGSKTVGEDRTMTISGRRR